MRLMPLLEKDLPTRVEWMNDTRVNSSMKLTLPITLEKTQAWFQCNRDNKKRADVTFYNDDDEIIAFGGITNIDSTIFKAETYMFVNPNMQGKGIGRTAKKLLCDYGFNVLGLHKLYFITNSTNIASQRMNANLGYKLEGILRDEIIHNGKYEDRYYYGLLASDFNNLK